MIETAVQLDFDQPHAEGKPYAGQPTERRGYVEGRE